MKKRILSLLISSCMLTSLCILPADAADAPANDMELLDSAWGDDYDSAGEFTISSEEDLLAFAQMVNSGKDFADKTVTLSQPIELTGENWVPIGSADILSDDYDADEAPFFAGTFDGEGYSISNLKLSFGIEESDPLYDYGGLFGHVTGTVKDVNLVDVSITAASEYFGGIAGLLDEGGTIENCTTSGTISGAEYENELMGSFIGGIVGASEGTIASCTNNCTISNTETQIGGIAGAVENGSVSDCTNTGKLEGTNYVGGIAGDVTADTRNKAAISGCSNMGEIQGKESGTRENRGFGGVVGTTTGDVTISDCSNSGTISAQGQEWIGGIVGQLYFGSTVEDCSNDGPVGGASKVGGIVGYASSYSSGGYEITGCQNTGAITGTSEVGGVVGTTTGAEEADLTLEVSNCTNAGSVSGSSSVGGIVGNHNSGEGIGDDNAAAVISGCINTGSVPEVGGVIVGTNNTGTTTDDSTEMVGKVENNFWPAELGANAVGSGAGSSDSESVEAVKNNSSYNTDGTLTTSVKASDGTEIKNLGDAINKVIGGGESGSGNIPDAMKVTVTYKNGGHGTAPDVETVTMGGNVTLPGMYNDGYYTFTGWSDGSRTYKARDTVTVMKDTTFTAQWRDDTPSSSGSTKYTVSVEDVDNGTIKVSPTRASKGSTVTINVTPDEGYELDKLVVTDKNGDTVKLTDKGSGTYTFKMSASKVTVEATFTQIVTEPETLPFTDVKTGDWFYEAVQYVYDKGMMTGVSADRFAPASTTTRGMIVTILYRLENEPAVSGGSAFTDVENGAWYADAVAWAAANDIVNGTSATTFAPNSPITREQMATMLYRFAQYKGMDAVTLQENLTGYPDGGQVSDYAIPAMNWAIGQGLIAGMENGTLVPQGSATRAQVATILMRFCESIG